MTISRNILFILTPAIFASLYLKNLSTQYNFKNHELNQLAHDSTICGKWTSTHDFYFEYLNFFNDSTFSYEMEGCTGKDYTKGNWKFTEDTLILTSLEEYNILEKDVDLLLISNRKIYLKNKRFVFKGDTLCKLGNVNKETESKFTKEKNNR